MPVEPPITSPTTLVDAYAQLRDGPVTPIAGGTDLMVALTGELGEPPERMLDLWHLDELRGITLDRAAVVLGALTTYTEIRRSSVCREHLPALVEAAATIGAAQIQNRGTIGGNAANASPAGDTLPSCSRSTPRSCAVRPVVNARCRRPPSGPPTGGRRSHPTSSCCGSGSRW
jgi:CO/xanthine dehydrogenase FAD-binding subunit